jgi:hypothetical protein
MGGRAKRGGRRGMIEAGLGMVWLGSPQRHTGACRDAETVADHRSPWRSAARLDGSGLTRGDDRVERPVFPCSGVLP